jgi:hypothetical protein
MKAHYVSSMTNPIFGYDPTPKQTNPAQKLVQIMLTLFKVWSLVLIVGVTPSLSMKYL